MVDVRDTIERLARERGDDLASLSRLLGRNAAYMQQFIRRGVPRKLDEEDRGTLARYFGVDEVLLGAPSPSPAKAVRDRLKVVARLPIGASAGPGALAGEERPQVGMAFDPRFLRDLTTNPDAISLIRVTGDSMVPTLSAGDDILVDTGDTADRLRDGIYVLRIDDAVNVKRIAMAPGKRFTIMSDNPAYPPMTHWQPDQVTVVGRVVWVGRRVS
jgi:hypothetical protein